MRLGVKAGFIVLAAAAGLAACATTLKTDVGWDQKVDFAKYHTWAWKPDGSFEDPVWAKRCQDVLSDQLANDGLTQVGLDRNPDLWAVVHVRFSSKTEVVAYSPAWGYAWGGWAPLSTYDVQIPVGTMIIDLVDPRMKQIVWRGRANDTIQADKNNEEREEKLISILKQLFTGFPPGVPPRTPSPPPL